MSLRLDTDNDGRLIVIVAVSDILITIKCRQAIVARAESPPSPLDVEEVVLVVTIDDVGVSGSIVDICRRGESANTPSSSWMR